MIVDCFIVQEPEPIDWEYYRRGIGSRLVDMYRQAYESMFHYSFADVTLMSFGLPDLRCSITAALC